MAPSPSSSSLEDSIQMSPDRSPADVAPQAVLDQDPRVEPVDSVDQRPRHVLAARPEGLQHGVDGRVRHRMLV